MFDDPFSAPDSPDARNERESSRYTIGSATVNDADCHMIYDMENEAPICFIEQAHDPKARLAKGLSIILNNVGYATDYNEDGIKALPAVVAKFHYVNNFFSELTEQATRNDTPLGAALLAATPKGWPLADIDYVPAAVFLADDISEEFRRYASSALPQPEPTSAHPWVETESNLEATRAFFRPGLAAPLHFLKDSESGEIADPYSFAMATASVDACILSMPQDPVGVAPYLREIVHYLYLAQKWTARIKDLAATSQKSGAEAGDESPTQCLETAAKRHGLNWSTLDHVLEITVGDARPHDIAPSHPKRLAAQRLPLSATIH